MRYSISFSYKAERGAVSCPPLLCHEAEQKTTHRSILKWNAEPSPCFSKLFSYRFQIHLKRYTPICSERIEMDRIAEAFAVHGLDLADTEDHVLHPGAHGERFQLGCVEAAVLDVRHAGRLGKELLPGRLRKYH